ncbi:MAG: membrane protein insertion efficiency factor YidD [Terriglobales bacterium]
MRQLPGKIVIQLLRGYKFAISPWLGTACRFQPTCSEYAIEAVELHGLIRGCLLATGRLLRCRPFGAGGYDPVRPEYSSAALSPELHDRWTE